jgi:hypothetical protein
VADFAAPMLGRTRGEVKRQRVETVPEVLKHRLADGGIGLPTVSVAAEEGHDEQDHLCAELLHHAVHSLKPVLFDELMEMIGRC